MRDLGNFKIIGSKRVDIEGVLDSWKRELLDQRDDGEPEPQIPIKWHRDTKKGEK